MGLYWYFPPYQIILLKQGINWCPLETKLWVKGRKPSFGPNLGTSQLSDLEKLSPWTGKALVTPGDSGAELGCQTASAGWPVTPVPEMLELRIRHLGALVGSYHSTLDWVKWCIYHECSSLNQIKCSLGLLTDHTLANLVGKPSSHWLELDFSL